MSSIYTNNLIDDGAGDDFRMFLLDEAARQAEISGYDIIRLTLGKADAPLHPEITKKMQDALGDMSKCNLVFPSGLPELRDALSTYYMNYAKIKVPASNILIDAGTSSIYRNIFGIILRDNPNVVLPKPYYPLYKITAELAGGNISYYSINEKSLKIDLESLRSVINKSTRAIVINSPGNPFGNIVDENSLYEIGRLMPKGSYLIFDEIYDNVKFKKSPPVIKTLLGTDEFAHLNIIITNAFSKGYRMYSRRLGWAILPDHLVNTITTLLHHTRLTVDPVVQFGGLEALKHIEQIEELNKEHLKRWNYTHKTLNNVHNIRLLESKGGFFCTIDCRNFIIKNRYSNCLKLAMDILEKAKVATVPGQDFGIPGMLRLSFTNKRYFEAIDRLKDYFKNE